MVLYGANAFSFNKELFALGTKTTFVPPWPAHRSLHVHTRMEVVLTSLPLVPCLNTRSEFGPAAFNAMHAPVVTTVDNIQEYWFKKKERDMEEVRWPRK